VTVPEFAIHWARQLGSSEKSMVQLRGGINNQVFRCGKRNCQWVIKAYPSHHLGQRDRMQAEVEFLRYANRVAPGRVPRLISVDTDRRCVVLEHIDGSSYPEGVPPAAEDVKAAVEFFLQLNADLGLARQMIHLDAAEGFLSIRQHMTNVRVRLNAMGTKHLPNEYKEKADKLIRQLQQQADRVENNLEAAISAGLVKDHLDPALRRVSPSDFGFHNAIRTTTGVTFIDFEFAGWDDPAKTCTDFILQPRIPSSNVSTVGQMIFECQKILGQDARLRAIKPILSLKWTCIILGILNAERLARIIEANPLQNTEQLISARLTTVSLPCEFE
jgi:hypothetical protein